MKKTQAFLPIIVMAATNIIVLHYSRPKDESRSTRHRASFTMVTCSSTMLNKLNEEVHYFLFISLIPRLGRSWGHHCIWQPALAISLSLFLLLLSLKISLVHSVMLFSRLSLCLSLSLSVCLPLPLSVCLCLCYPLFFSPGLFLAVLF